jgi:hypothetical protein
MSTKNEMKNSIMNLTQEALDVEELERRLEMAAAVAACDCCGSNGTPCSENSGGGCGGCPTRQIP